MSRTTSIAPRRGVIVRLALHQRPAARDARAGYRHARTQRAGHQPPPLKKAAPPPPAKPPPPPPPSPPPPRRLPSLEVRLLVLELVVLAVGRTTVSPALRPLRIIVEVLPASPVTTRRRTCLPARFTVTLPAEIALVGTFTPSACLTTTSAVALIPTFKPGSSWSSWKVT